MPLDLLIARWVAIFWVVFGISHLLHPAKWGALLLPLRERETGGFVLAGLSLPIGLIIVLGHNIWAWDLRVIVTLAGWMTTLKSIVYLLFPEAHQFVMRRSNHQKRGLRLVGGVMIMLGGVTLWDSWSRP